MSAERNFTEQDYELLSAYLDGALTAAERAGLETRLQTDDGLRQELESLRQTVKLVGSLPALKAPRNFTITASMVGSRQNRWLIFPTSAAFSGVAAAAATILILIGAGMFFLRNTATSTSAPSVMQSAEMEQEVPTQIAFISTQTSITSNITAEKEATNQIQASVTAPPMTDLLETQIILTAGALSDESIGNGGDGFSTSTDSLDMEQSPAAGEISAYSMTIAPAEDQTTQTIQSAAPIVLTLNPEATLFPPAQPPTANNSAAQVGGNSEPDSSTQSNMAQESGLADQTNAVASETASPTLNREGLVPLTASAPASAAVFAQLSSATPEPTMTASPKPTHTPSPTLSQTPMARETEPSQPEGSQRAAEPTATTATDFAPFILLAGFILLMIAVITTFMRRRG